MNAGNSLMESLIPSHPHLIAHAPHSLEPLTIHSAKMMSPSKRLARVENMLTRTILDTTFFPNLMSPLITLHDELRKKSDGILWYRWCLLHTCVANSSPWIGDTSSSGIMIGKSSAPALQVIEGSVILTPWIFWVSRSVSFDVFSLEK